MQVVSGADDAESYMVGCLEEARAFSYASERGPRTLGRRRIAMTRFAGEISPGIGEFVSFRVRGTLFLMSCPLSRRSSCFSQPKCHLA